MEAWDALKDDPIPVHIALVQNDAEVLRTPGYNVLPLLKRCGEERRRWHVESFSDRSFASGLAARGRFDAIIFGFNAIHNTEQLRAALELNPPTGNIAILHQLSPESVRFMRGEVKLGMRRFTRATRRAQPPIVAERGAAEPLLNWPTHPLGQDDHIGATALLYHSYEPGTVWRTVLETRRGGQRLPVLVRTVSTCERRIVACSLLLQVAQSDGKTQDEGEETLSSQEKLLLNIVEYCARGPIDIAVLDGGETDVARRRARKLSLQGVNAVVVRGNAKANVSLDSWPIAGTGRVLVPEGIDPDEGIWTRQGGVVVRCQSDGLSLSGGATDAEWVATRWATWFRSVEPGTWLAKKIFPARAVLRTVAVLREEVEEATGEERLCLPKPSEFRGEVQNLLSRRLGARLGGRLSFEETISTTAAACDLRDLVGGALPGRARALRRWLRAEVRNATPEDRLDVARCLRDINLLRRTLEEELRRERIASALFVTRLCEAAVACKVDPTLPQWWEERLDSEELAADLDGHLQLSANFVAATLAARMSVELRDSPLAHPPDAALDRAVAVIARLGVLSQMECRQPEHIDPEEISVEAQAMVRYMKLEDTPTSLASTQAASVSVKTLEGVLRENERARRAETEAKRAQLPLTAAFPILTALALTVILGGLFRVTSWFGVDDKSLRVPTGLFVLLAGAAVAACLTRFYVLRTFRKREDADRQLAQWAITAFACGGVAIGFARFHNFDSAAVGVTSLLAWLLVLTGALVALAALGLAPRQALRIPKVLGGLDKLPGIITDWATQNVRQGK